ncbi:hypothetical protein [Phaeobacter sp. J2-8]|uniref:hypothetical protein n=1 Tax=Phaeobacter sp. J2-8 TaxID=2931394 RepID=UPI001FD2A553|nr:hypothetical protein [Phaeobacter sp. J2-8]MCJ7871546.1 hypothetical protein [Phaeobacter sp. J2-8]
MVMRRFGKSWVLGALAVLVPGMSLALDQVDLQLVGSDNADLTKSLNSASVLTTLEKSPETLPRDVVAAAQADYAKLVEALYAQGYYSAVVNIQIDGREAATIDPFRLPAAVGNVVITVQPGRAFRLGQVQIAPLAGEDPPVPGFARDEPALATVVRDAAQGAVRDWREAGHAKAEITGQSIEARHASARLDVDVRIAPGPRLRFGDTSVDGTSTVRDARVRQIAPACPKARYLPPKPWTRPPADCAGPAHFNRCRSKRPKPPVPMANLTWKSRSSIANRAGLVVASNIPPLAG